MASWLDKLAHAWNAFQNADDYRTQDRGSAAGSYGVISTSRPDRTRYRVSNERSIILSMYTRIAIDAAAAIIRHVKLDANDRYLETVNSGLNTCLTLEANIDQGARAFRQDMFMTMFDEGVIAVVPVDTDLDPDSAGNVGIKTMRVGRIVSWMPRHVRVNLYNDITGQRQEITLKKEHVAIVENPLYSVMNEPNSTLQRLIRKLNILDSVDEAAGSGKLDLIIQLPYVVKTDTRRAEVDKRAKDIEMQLQGSKYGIAYTDGTEKVTQLNRPAENNMLKQIEFLTSMLYGQLGLTPAIFDGSANEEAMLNYHNRTIEPILSAFTEEFKRKFLTKTARTQKQSIEYFRDPFKLVAVGSIAEIADKLTRNEVLTSNEVRGILGFTPAKDPNADKLMNKNLPQPEPIAPTAEPPSPAEQESLASIPIELLA